ncbi:hypothetical protein [uncultured Gimesia sp.]|uniref:hypothetical protein n=1 Tax=uncultured Gimesia sp. TaxID=1678688 RepID=UPI0030D9FB88|tara:strand:- start:36029 stop:37282 length:1254 start_codon:yes stop_codon:yes gene_type:complete
MNTDLLTVDFEKRIESWVVRGVRMGAGSFDDLLVRLPGVYPPLLRAAIERLKMRELIPASLSEKLLQTRVHFMSSGADPCPMPMEHPLDYDWRFTSETVDCLIEQFSLLGEDGPLMCLGTPSVFDRMWFRDHRTILFDRNDLIINYFRKLDSGAEAFRVNLVSDKIPRGIAGAVILDPPWYPEYMDLFLWSAAQVLKPNGIALASFPPEGTRPECFKENKDIISRVRHYGLEKEGIDKGAVLYRTPNFERNSLAANNINLGGLSWRKGNLILFRLARRIEHKRPIIQDSYTCWKPYHVRGLSLRVKDSYQFGFCDPRLNNLVCGDVLPSVSRRDPIRKRAMVWTTGNRVFACNGSNTLRHIIEILQIQENDFLYELGNRMNLRLSQRQRDQVKIAVEQIFNLVDLETSETKMNWITN